MLNRIANFMRGRNGMDALNFGLLAAAVVVSAVGVFIKNNTVFTVLRVVSTLLLLLAIWRMLSRKVSKRSRENARFLKLTAGLRTLFANFSGRLMGDGSHTFFNCPSCHNRLRVPSGKGKIEITCPRCGTRFSRKS